MGNKGYELPIATEWCQTEKKKYCVWLTNAQHGTAHVEAIDPEDAVKQATELYNNRSIDWYEEGLSEINPEEE